MFWNKNIFYTVKRLDNPTRIYTITKTKKEAEEYINKILFIEHKQDFESWCFYQKIKPEDMPTAWVKYFNTRLSSEEKLKYRYYKVKYNDYEIAAILRLFCNCTPIGCSFDAPFEKKYLEDKMDSYKKFAEKIVETMEQQLDESPLDESEEEELVQ